MNMAKTFFLLMVMSALLLMAGAALGGEAGIIIALIFALVMNFSAYWFSDRIALGMHHAHPVTEQEDPDLFRGDPEQAGLAGLPMPKLYKIESDSPNAFATVRNPSHATLAATTGIIQILDREELGAVIAHEMAHVGNRDTLIMAVVAGILGLLVVAIVMPLAAGLVRAAVSRTREFQTGAAGAHTCGNPLALASALEKLEMGVQSRPMKAAEGASHLFIVNPLRGKSMARLFSTHPPIEERVRRLRDTRPNF